MSGHRYWATIGDTPISAPHPLDDVASNHLGTEPLLGAYDHVCAPDRLSLRRDIDPCDALDADIESAVGEFALYVFMHRYCVDAT